MPTYAGIFSKRFTRASSAPPGCAHGFCVISELALVHYKCTALYDRDDEVGIAYNDPTLAISWPISEPVLSPKDQSNMSWADFVALLSRSA